MEIDTEKIKGTTLDIEKIEGTIIPEDKQLFLMLRSNPDIENVVLNKYLIPEASLLAEIQKAGEERDIQKGLEAALEIEEVMLSNGSYYRSFGGKNTEEIVNGMRETVNKNPSKIFEEYSFYYMNFLDYAKIFLVPSEVSGVEVERSVLEELRHKVYGGPDKETMEKSLELLGYNETAKWVVANLNRTRRLAEFYGGETGWAENNPGAASTLISKSEKIAKEIEDVKEGLGYKRFNLPPKNEWEKRTQQS
jgi:hypothetical protein